MNYKDLIKNQKTRLKILELFNFVPDKTMLKIQYRLKTGRKLNLKTPKRYTEKLQWSKLYYRNDEMIRCVDKYDVRSYIKTKGLEHTLNKCYGVYESPDDIDFELLPNQFVLKDTLGGGGISVIICKDKKSFDIESAKKTMHEWCDTRIVRNMGREWPYYNGKKHRIIIEEYLECLDGDLPDYKFFCFEGSCKCSFTRIDYASSHKVYTQFFDADANPIQVKMDYSQYATRKVKLPNNFKEMQSIAERLSSDFPHVRVDLYNVEGRIVFGEMTFFHASGYVNFEPDEFDYKLGEEFILPEIIGGGYSEEVIILVYTCCDLQDLEVAA